MAEENDSHILVTGGAAFIGSNFIRRVLHSQPEARITNLDKLTYAGNPDNVKDIANGRRYRFVQGDICDPDAVEAAFGDTDIDAVVHFAAETHVDRSIEHPSEFVRTNVLGTHVLLEAALRHETGTFIHVSTDEVYGSIETGSFREENDLNPSSPYSASKAGSDLLVRSYFTTFGLPAIITRCTNNFGPYQFPEKLIPLFVTNLIEGRKVPLYGTGLNVRDWLFVADHCDALQFLLGSGIAGEIYNISGGNEYTNIEIARFILAELGYNEEMIAYVADRPGHDTRYSLDSSKLRRLGWKPAREFGEALRETIRWYRDNEWWWRALRK